MAEQQKNGNETQKSSAADSPRPVRFVEDGAITHYAGAFNIGMGADEMVLFFGNPAMEQNVIRIENKVAVSLKTAKRIALTLSNLLQRYESIHGVLDISAPQQAGGHAQRDVI